MQKWEYKTETAVFVSQERLLKAMGESGWELCGVFGHPKYITREYYFKRPIQQPSTGERIFEEVKNEVEGGHMKVKTT